MVKTRRNKSKRRKAKRRKTKKGGGKNKRKLNVLKMKEEGKRQRKIAKTRHDAFVNDNLEDDTMKTAEGVIVFDGVFTAEERKSYEKQSEDILLIAEKKYERLMRRVEEYSKGKDSKRISLCRRILNAVKNDSGSDTEDDEAFARFQSQADEIKYEANRRRCRLEEDEDFKMNMAEAEAWKLVEGNYHGPPSRQLRLLLRDLSILLLEEKLYNGNAQHMQNKYSVFRRALRNWSLKTCTLLMSYRKESTLFPTLILVADMESRPDISPTGTERVVDTPSTVEAFVSIYKNTLTELDINIKNILDSMSRDRTLTPSERRMFNFLTQHFVGDEGSNFQNAHQAYLDKLVSEEQRKVDEKSKIEEMETVKRAQNAHIAYEKELKDIGFFRSI